MRLYGISVDGNRSRDGTTCYPFINWAQPKSEYSQRCTGCHCGYLDRYTLTTEGQLILTGFAYIPTQEGTHDVHEPLTGDFWLSMKCGFRGETTYIPFLDGKIITDKSEWVVGKCPVEKSLALQETERERAIAWRKEHRSVFDKLRDYFFKDCA